MWLLGFTDLVDVITGCLNEASDHRVEGRASKHEFMMKKGNALKIYTEQTKMGKADRNITGIWLVSVDLQYLFVESVLRNVMDARTTS